MCQALCQVLVTRWSLIDGGNDPTWKRLRVSRSMIQLGRLSWVHHIRNRVRHPRQKEQCIRGLGDGSTVWSKELRSVLDPRGSVWGPNNAKKGMEGQDFFPTPTLVPENLGIRPKVNQAGGLTRLHFQEGMEVEGRSRSGSLQSCLPEEGGHPMGSHPRQALAQPHLDSFCKSIWLRHLTVGGPGLGGPSKGSGPCQAQDLGTSTRPPLPRGPSGSTYSPPLTPQ